MNVIPFKARKTAPERGGVTLFLHIRKTTLIAHLSPPRQHRGNTHAPRKTSRTLS